MSTKVNIADAPWQTCDCGGMLFQTATMVKRLSALMSPDGIEHMVPLEVHLCRTCGKIPSFLSKEIPGLPEDLKAVKSSNIQRMPTSRK
jgi:hypothetical protein